MAIPIWPTGLPQKPLLSGYSEQAPNNLLRSQSESGVVKVRPKGAAKPWVLSVSFALSESEKADFLDFVENILKDGALRFSFRHPSKGIDVEVRIVPGNESLFTLTRYGFDWLVSFKLEVLP